MKIMVRCVKCGRLLGIFKETVGVVKCPDCGHVQKVVLDI